MKILDPPLPLVYIINYRISVQIFLGSERVSYTFRHIAR